MHLDKKKTAKKLFLTAVFLLVIDRFLKQIALFLDKDIRIIGDFFQFSFVKNYNIAFSLPLHGLFLEIILSLIIIALIVYTVQLAKKKHYLESSLLTIIVIGAISNIADRFKYGFVIDYFDLKYFTVFNLADAMIVIGVFLLIFINHQDV